MFPTWAERSITIDSEIPERGWPGHDANTSGVEKVPPPGGALTPSNERERAEEASSVGGRKSVNA